MQLLRSGNRRALAKMITLVESSLKEHIQESSLLVEKILRERTSSTKETFRIGISGVPGVGKSTFIETFGQYLIKKGHKVAVLAVDPSSSIAGGSILGDKTRMIHLSRDPNAYVRPSPARGTLGGVGKNTTEAVLLCEEAGYDIIIIETVGVGQSETVVESMVDMYLLLVLPSGGDELQGIKKGIVELADLIVVNKADGDLERSARFAQFEYMNALKFVNPKFPFWRAKVLRCSSLTQEGVDVIWEHMSQYLHEMKQRGAFQERRSEQSEDWMWRILNEMFKTRLLEDKSVLSLLPSLKKDTREHKITPYQAAELLLKSFFKNSQ
uniref:AAA+ ATPase domain-containing protein n=1 Tax=Arcella intermedia TaxID=1963864 RepID=A0A6B2L9Q6_9EUKA